jgi:hypothetical protein
VTTQPPDKKLPEAITDKLPCLSLKGERNPRAKLTEAKVIAMRKYAAEGNTSFECALVFDVSQSTAYKAIVGRSWQHVQ